jgi:excisionase family DNA binding protein
MHHPNNVAADERRALRVDDAALTYGIGRSTIYKLMSQGKLATVKILGRRLIPRDVMEALIAGESKSGKAA